MPKFTPERAKELMPLSRPKINGKVLYSRLPIAKRIFVIFRNEGRLFIGKKMLGDVLGVHELHPETIPVDVIPDGIVAELKFGTQYRIGKVIDEEPPRSNYEPR